LARRQFDFDRTKQQMLVVDEQQGDPAAGD
jgi:hypothetical protein